MRRIARRLITSIRGSTFRQARKQRQCLWASMQYVWNVHEGLGSVRKRGDRGQGIGVTAHADTVAHCQIETVRSGLFSQIVIARLHALRKHCGQVEQSRCGCVHGVALHSFWGSAGRMVRMVDCKQAGSIWMPDISRQRLIVRPCEPPRLPASPTRRRRRVTPTRPRKRAPHCTRSGSTPTRATRRNTSNGRPSVAPFIRKRPYRHLESSSAAAG